MTRDDSPIDDLLRSHFAGELDRQRGRCERAFLQQVTGPMQRRLDEPAAPLKLPRWRNYSAIGLAMAACVAIGFALPTVLSRDAAPATVAAERAGRPVDATIVSTLSPTEQTTLLDNFDAGPAFEGDRPVQKIRQQIMQRYVWTDPVTKMQYEYFVPSEQEVFAPAVRQ
jgi:hypothetical protein